MDVVHHGVGDHVLDGARFGKVGIAMDVAEKQSPSMIAGVHLRLDFHVGAVVFPHETNLDHALSDPGFEFDHPFGIRYRGRQRLFEEHGLAGLQAFDCQFGMEAVRGRDEQGIHLRVADDVTGLVEQQVNPVPVTHGGAQVPVKIHHGFQGCSRYAAAAEVVGMVAAHGAYSDHTDPNG